MGEHKTESEREIQRFLITLTLLLPSLSPLLLPPSPSPIHQTNGDGGGKSLQRESYSRLLSSLFRPRSHRRRHEGRHGRGRFNHHRLQVGRYCFPLPLPPSSSPSFSNLRSHIRVFVGPRSFKGLHRPTPCTPKRVLINLSCTSSHHVFTCPTPSPTPTIFPHSLTHPTIFPNPSPTPYHFPPLLPAELTVGRT